MPPMNRQRRRQRRIRRRRQAQQRFTEPLTGQRAGKIAGRQAQQAYRPTERQIQGEIRGSARQGKNLGNWYDQFAQQMEASRVATQQAYDTANARIAETMGTAGEADTQRQEELSADAKSRSALTGAPSSTRGPQQRAEAARQSGLFGAALQAPVIGQQANAFAYQTNQSNYARREGLEQRLKERRRRRGMQQDLRALRKERGAYRVDKLNELRQSDRDYKIQRSAFGLDKRKQRQAEQEGRFERGSALRDEKRKDRELGLREREIGQEGRRVREGEKGGPSPSERRAAKEDRRNAISTARSLYRAAKKKPNDGAAWAAFQQLVAKESEVSPQAAAWAIKRLRRQLSRNRQGNRGIPNTTKVPFAP